MAIEQRRLVIKWRRHVFVLGLCFAGVVGMRVYMARMMQSLRAEVEATQERAVIDLPQPVSTLARP